VVKQGDDYVLKTVATIVENDQDKHVASATCEVAIQGSGLEGPRSRRPFRLCCEFRWGGQVWLLLARYFQAAAVAEAAAFRRS